MWKRIKTCLGAKNYYSFRSVRRMSSTYMGVQVKRPGSLIWVTAYDAREDGYENDLLIKACEQKELLDKLASDPEAFEKMQELRKKLRKDSTNTYQTSEQEHIMKKVLE